LNTLEVPVIKQVPKPCICRYIQVYHPKKLFKKPNLGEFQIKTVFSSYSVVVVMTHDSRARALAKRNCIYKFRAHSTYFDCFSLCNAKNSDSSIPKPVTKILAYVLCIAQSCPKYVTYAPFTKNRREIVMIQKNDRLGFISFEKAFSSSSYSASPRPLDSFFHARPVKLSKHTNLNGVKVRIHEMLISNIKLELYLKYFYYLKIKYRKLGRPKIILKVCRDEIMWYYCLAGKGTMDITHEWCPKITSGEATSDFGTTSV
jgi:hypothetical protein